MRRNKAAPAQRFPPPKPPKKTAKVVFDAPDTEPEQPRTFRLGVVPGATPGKWIDACKKRMPHVPIELVTIEVAVYGRAGRQCRRCGTPIRRGEQGADPTRERITFWCPVCQR